MAPRERVHAAWGAAAFLASGFVAGVCGMGVLPGAVVWVGALLGLAVGRRLPKSRLRPVAYILLAVIGVVSMLPQVLDWLRPGS